MMRMRRSCLLQSSEAPANPLAAILQLPWLRSAMHAQANLHEGSRCSSHRVQANVAPDLMEGFGLIKSFREIIQNQLLFEGFGIMKSFWDRNKKIADSEF